MPIFRSKVTTQGQISVPVEVRNKLGIGPGSTLEWEEDKDGVVVLRAGCVSSEDIYRALFPKDEPKPKSLEQLKAGIRDYTRNRNARG